MTEIETAVGSAVKVTCPKDELTRALAVVGRAVSTRASVQVLGGVLLRGGEGSLELAATDMELSLRLSVEAQVEGQGAVVAPGRLLVDLARLLPDSEVVLEHRAEQGVLEITCGPAAYKLNTYSALRLYNGLSRTGFDGTVFGGSRHRSRERSRSSSEMLLFVFDRRDVPEALL